MLGKVSADYRRVMSQYAQVSVKWQQAGSNLRPSELQSE